VAYFFFCEYFIIEIHFHGEKLLAPRPTPQLEDQSLLAVRDCLFNIFAATLLIGGCSYVSNLTTCHAVLTGNGMDWIELAQDRYWWRAIVNAVMNLKVP
jgi:hypothetical protein